jgi:hypothetical protein
VRPDDIQEEKMDLTYFYDNSIENEDADLATGFRVRESPVEPIHTLARFGRASIRLVREQDEPARYAFLLGL